MKNRVKHQFGIFLLFVTFVISYQIGLAQNMHVKTLHSNRFQPAANLKHIVEDKDGFLWYATDAGLWRDDGYRVDAFRNDNANPHFWKSNNVLDIACSAGGKIWMATDAGLYYVSRNDYRLVEVKDERLAKGGISAISAVHDGSIWVFAGRNIFHVSSEGKVLKVYKAQNEGDGSKCINAVYDDSRKNLWMTECRGGMLRYNASTDHFDRCEWPADCEPYGGMYEDTAHGCFWVATWGRGIVKYVPIGTANNGEVTFQPCTYSTDNYSKGQIISMQGRGNTLWCSAMDGFYAYDITREGTLIPHSLDGFLPEGKNIFASITKDASDNILVASYSPRSFIIHPQDYDIKRYSLPGILKFTGMQMVASTAKVDSDGYIWLWHLRFGVVLFNPFTGEFNMARNLLRWNLNTHIIEQCKSKNGVWTTEGNAIYRLWHEGMAIRSEKVTELANEPICLHDDGYGRLWISTSKGIEYYDDRQRMLKRVSSSSGWVSKMQISADGKAMYFLSQPKGLSIMNIKSKTVEQISDSSFSSICISPDGQLWASTSIGSVYRASSNGNHPTKMEKELELEDCDAVLSLSFDRIGHLWLLTNKYVREYSTSLKSSRTLSGDDPDIDIDFFSFMECNGDNIYIGGAGGFCKLSSYPQLNKTSNAPAPLISSYIIDGKKAIMGVGTKEICINHSNINLEVNFSTLNHIHPERVTYAYCLHHVDEQTEKWTTLPTGQSTAYFSGLSKGDYIVSVKATDEYGNWSKECNEIVIHRLPAWWDTWWMYIIYSLLFIALIAYVLHFYFRNEMQRMEIQKLLALAKELRQAQAKEAVLQPEPETEPEAKRTECQADILFVKKAKEKVEENMKNVSYTTELFASDMCMSRMSLYRRLQSVTGQTPTEFMRMIRLHAAAELLKSDDLPISEVASRTGFATPSYFTKCFKEAFGVLPTEYKKR